MPKGAYTGKQKREAEHTAERRALVTMNKEVGGGKKSGSGRGNR